MKNNNKRGRTRLPVDKRMVQFNVGLRPTENDSALAQCERESKTGGIKVTRSALMRKALIEYLERRKVAIER